MACWVLELTAEEDLCTEAEERPDKRESHAARPNHLMAAGQDRLPQTHAILQVPQALRCK